MTATSLRNQSCKELAQMARSVGLAGWHSMRKDELVRALVNHARRKPKRSVGGVTDSSSPIAVMSRNGGGPRGKAARMKEHEGLRQLRNRLSEIRQISSSNGHESKREAQDRLVVMVRDPYWLHAYWELAPRSVERAQSALGQHWHATRPVLRLFHVAADGADELQREIPIHGGVNHWYV